MVKIMKTVFEWIMLKDSIKVNFNNYLDDAMNPVLEIRMDCYSTFTKYSKDNIGLLIHSITVERCLYDQFYTEDEEKIIDILDEMYETCMDIIKRLRN